MNKIIKAILSIFIKVSCIIGILLFSLYFGLWIYVIHSIPEDLKQQYDQYNIYDITEQQYQIIWFTWTGNKNYRFKWQPFIFDTFSKDYLQYSSLIMIYKNEKVMDKLKLSPIRLPVWNIEYGIWRYIKKENNYKKCINVIITNGYIDGKIFGMEDACKHYFNKKLIDVTDKELISLSLLMFSPRKYGIGYEISEEKTNQIYSKFYGFRNIS
jgi:hypothetical protein